MEKVELSQQDIKIIIHSLAKVVVAGGITIEDSRLILALYDKISPLVKIDPEAKLTDPN